MKHLVTAALAAAVTAATLVAAPPPATAAAPDCQTRVSSRHPIDRLSGINRYATAACTSQVGFPSGAPVVLLARGDNAGGWADALAGTVLAHDVGGPVLLTEPDRLPQDTADEIQRLGAATVVILGGRGAVSSRVAAQVQALGATVDRVSGATRADTAAEIARRAGATENAYVVNGYRPADALVAGAAAARAGAGLLLTTPDGVPPATDELLRRADTATVVGGFGVVNETTEARIRALVGTSDVQRLGGSTRDATAAAVARTHATGGAVHVVSGDNAHLVDAISASWLAARPGGGPVLYAAKDEPLGQTDRWLRLGGLEGRPTTRVVGGGSVLAPALVSVLESRYDEAAAGGPSAEMRAFWVHLFDDSLKSRAGIERVVNAAASANLNTIIVQAARRQDAYYTSSVLPRTPDPRMPRDLDMLARLIPEAHAHGLDVQVWYSLMPTYHSAYEGLPQPDGWVWKEHGPSSSDPWTTKFEPMGGNRSSIYMDPAVPGVQDHIVAMLREVVQRYDVDGVHLDYLRYDGKQWGYHPKALERFRRETGRTDTPSGLDEEWNDWRRRQTAELARRIYTEVADVDPDIPVTMASIAQGQTWNNQPLTAWPPRGFSWEQTRAYEDKFQDWRVWALGGWIDQIFPMNYFTEDKYPGWYDWYVTFSENLAAQSGRQIAIGQASYLNPVSDSLKQIDEARERTDGVVLYSYQGDFKGASASTRGDLLDTLRATRFEDPAPAPEVTWKTRPSGGHVSALVSDGQQVTFTPDGISGASARTVRADATGHATAVWLPAGRWTVTSPGRASRTVTVSAGRTARVSWP